MKWVDVQRRQFMRLGVLGDWPHPYLTLDPRYEAGILDVLADLIEGGYVVPPAQAHPLVHHRSDGPRRGRAGISRSVDAEHLRQLRRRLGRASAWGDAGPWSLMIWTTTPWTLPANVAVAVHPDLEYAGIRYVEPTTGDVTQTILAAELAPKVMGRRGIEFTEVGRCRGRELEGAEYRHPFIDRVGPIVLAQYVSVEDGTGLVHTAPGHGAEDYQTGRAYGLPVLSPVDESGRFTADGPRLAVRPAGLCRQSRDRRSGCENPGTCFTSSRFRTAIRTAGGARSR